MNTRTTLFAVTLAVLSTGAFWGAHTLRQLRSEMAAVRQQLAEMSPRAMSEETIQPSRRNAEPRRSVADRSLSRRIEELEQAVAELARASDYLMERGQLPLGANKIEDLIRLLGDPTAADRDRLRALGLIRRNGTMSDEAVQQTLGWLQSSTNAGTRRELVQHLRGVTNAAVKAPLLGMMSTEPNSNVREQVAESLRGFVNDPAVESALWNAALNDPDGE